MGEKLSSIEYKVYFCYYCCTISQLIGFVIKNFMFLSYEFIFQYLFKEAIHMLLIYIIIHGYGLLLY